MVGIIWDELAHRYGNLILEPSPETAYADWEAFRAWFNVTFCYLDCFLEDAWNEHAEGETRLEYYVRSPKSKQEVGPLAYDSYSNHCDAKGVWHLGAYGYSRLPEEGVIEVASLVAFCKQHDI